MIEKITVKGAVQGVGYRPFILKKATEYQLRGFVQNIGAAVDILVIGEKDNIFHFINLIKCEYPSGAFIFDVENTELNSDEYLSYLNSLNIDPGRYLNDGDQAVILKNDQNVSQNRFDIIPSSEIDLSKEISVFLPDIGICDDCLSEMLDLGDRRFNYPLISCATCGPRISILDKLPYDRDNTSMIDFKMCPKCFSEYKNGRRRHAQTISCFDCGPQIMIKFLNSEEQKEDNPVLAASLLLEDDIIIGLKGMSGYQLICKPSNEAAGKLRDIKGREKKPFAIMFSDINSIKEYCYCNKMEEELLKSFSRPIVLLNTRKSFPYDVCKDSRYIGAFLPSTGIHRLLCDSNGPLIVTSANKSDEPIIIDDQAFLDTFSGLDVSAVLYHKRRINIPQDDSVAYVVNLSEGKNLSIISRRSRGYVPLPLFIRNCSNRKSRVLSFGADLKSTFSFAHNDRIVTSAYLGDLKDIRVYDNLKMMIAHFRDIYKFTPDLLVCDMHPMYESVKMAEDYSKKQNLPVFRVQHHHAHILSVMAENSLKSCIGVALDGTGYGPDGNVWGGEFLYCCGTEFERKGHLNYVTLCGGDNASKKAYVVKECYDYALGSEYQISHLLKGALDNNVNTFKTSSMGRLFDAVSALLQIQTENSFEGECAIALEKAAWCYADDNKESIENDTFFKAKLEIIVSSDCNGENELLLDQLGFFDALKKAFESGEYSKEELAFSFHIAIVEAICDVCRILRLDTSENKVCLSGGVFGNRLLLSRTYEALRKMSFDVFVNESVPANDAGISVGQAYYCLLKE